jgi:hypothetical protein
LLGVSEAETKSVPSKSLPAIADEAPSSCCLTSYDIAHLVLYLQVLDACADGVPEEEIAQEILGIDPLEEPLRARRAVESHLRRARWMREVGYRYLATG